MKTRKLIRICFSIFLCCCAVIVTDAFSQTGKEAAVVEKGMQSYMPILKGTQWLKMDPNSKVAFIWGVAHVIAVEQVLMDEIPELKRDGFVAKVFEARAAKGGTGMTMNSAVSLIDQHYKDHPDQLDVSVMQVIWNVMVRPYIKTGIAGRPLK
jgi:hypothetical protein